MSLQQSLFKAYDIRGFSPRDLDEDAAFRIGQALVKFTKAKTVVVGRDMRETSPALSAALQRGIHSLGADTIDIGLATTPLLYYAVGSGAGYDAGVMVTASHNPKEYNGLKLCYGDAQPIGAESGMWDVRDLALEGPYRAHAQVGSATTREVLPGYLETVFGLCGAITKRFRIVIDGGNGMGGLVLPHLMGMLPSCVFDGLYLDPDGNFPNHEANPLKESTLDALKKKMADVDADIGFAFDGDADRIGVVDETGRVIRGDIVAALLAPRILRKYPGAVVLYDVRSSMVVAEEIARAGGKPMLSRVGHGLIKPMMREYDACFAAELSCHFYFKDFWSAECSDLVLLLILELMQETGKPLSELVAPLMRYAHSGERNFRVQDKVGVMARLKEVYAHDATEITEIDGIRIDARDVSDPMKSWWFNVRASNTEPLLRLNAEAATPMLMEEKCAEISNIILAMGGEREE